MENESMTINASYVNTTTPVTHETTMSVVKWINGLIIILGFITNSLILVILARRRIGSQTTRIILMFLAAADIIVMLDELLIHYIPMHWQWFPVFYTDTSCAVAFWVQVSVITTSAWYITLMTTERFIAVYFPIKAKIMCTRRKVFVACVLIPVFSLMCFCYLLVDIVSYRDEDNYLQCQPSKKSRAGFKSKIILWIVIYFFIPATAIVMLNVAIVVKLANAHKLQRAMTSVIRTMPTTNSVKGRAITRSKSTSSSSHSIRKATTLVIAASVTFVLLMIPRGVSTTLSLDADWDYKSVPLLILDHVAYQLQYLNHSINFFLYVLANNNFRKELCRIFGCSGGKCQPRTFTAHKYIDSDLTQMTQLRSARSSQLPTTSPDHELSAYEETGFNCEGDMELTPLKVQMTRNRK